MPTSLISAKNQKGFAPIFLVLITVVVLAAIGGAYYWGTQKNQPATTPQVVQSQPTAIPNPTADWKTYSDTTVTFKYPPTWNTGLFPDKTYGLIVTPNEILKNVDGGKWETMTITEDQSVKGAYESDATKVVESKPVVINGAEAVEYKLTYKVDLPSIRQGDVFIITKFNANGKKYSVQLLEPKYAESYNILLSTIKFKNSASSDTANWVISSFPEDGYTYKVPIGYLNATRCFDNCIYNIYLFGGGVTNIISSLDAYIKSLNTTNPNINSHATPYVEDYQKIQLDGVDAVKTLTPTGKLAGSGPMITVVFIKDGKSYSFGYTYLDEKLNTVTKLNQLPQPNPDIFSTFKFTK